MESGKIKGRVDKSFLKCFSFFNKNEVTALIFSSTRAKKIFKLLYFINFITLSCLPIILITFILLIVLPGCGLFYYDRVNSSVSDITNDGNNKDSASGDNNKVSDNNNNDEPLNIFLVSEVIDGDTFIIGNGERVRLLGINTPEIDRYYYGESKEVLKIMVEDKKVKLEKDITDKDDYGRFLRYIYLEDLFVNLEMVKRGFANVFTMPPDVKFTEILLEAERFARENEIGLWERSRTSGIKITVNYDAAGDDKKNLNGEYIILENSNSNDINIDGWSIKDSATNIYDFSSFIFKSNSIIFLFTGSGDNSQKEGKLYWGSTRPIWNNDHDTLYIRDKYGLLVEIYNY